MTKVILDASALLAFLQGEPGAQIVEKYLPNAIISAVNAAEVMTILLGANLSQEEAEESIQDIAEEIIPFDFEQATISASLRNKTKSYGLSLADRACLALAKIKNLPVLTADKIWDKLDEGIKIQLIR